MTKEEAIEDLQLALSTGNYIFTKSRETLRMAISALSENKGDLISRTEVINAIDEREDVNGNVNAEDIRTDICLIPSKSDKGEWIEVVTERFPNGEKRMWHYECSVCSTGEPPCPINKEHWDFCPNCGADMRPEPYKESEVINGSQEI